MRHRTAPLRYFFLRTKTDIPAAYDAIEGLEQEFGHAEIYSPLGRRLTWANGLAMRLRINLTPAELARDCADVLGLFDAWAIHDVNNGFAENIAGPVSLFMDENPGEQHSTSLAHLFIVHRWSDRDPAATTDIFRESLNCPTRSAFHFTGGGIVLARTRQPAPTMVARLKPLDRRAWSVGACDHEGQTLDLRDHPRPLWDFMDLRELLNRPFGNRRPEAG